MFLACQLNRFGGCKYLQKAHIKLIGQNTVLQVALQEKEPWMFREKLSDNENKYLMFGRKSFHLTKGREDRELYLFNS